MPHLVDFPGCCTAKIVTGFGQTGYGERRYAPLRPLSVDDILTFLEDRVRMLRRAGNIALLYATTNSEQTIAEEALKKFGFVPTEAVSKNQHMDVKLTGWHYIIGNKPVEPEKDIKAALPPGFIQKAPVEAVRKPQRGFQIGDRVRITENIVIEQYQFGPGRRGGLGWNSDMMHSIGNEGVIFRVDEEMACVQTTTGNWWWDVEDIIFISRNGRDIKGRFVKKV